MIVERLDRGARGRRRRGRDGPVVEHVVRDDQTAGVHPRDQLFPVRDVVLLVRVEIGEIDMGLGGHRAQGVQRGRDPQVDAGLDTGLGPCLPPVRRPLLRHIAGDQPAVGGQRLGHGQRGEAGEGADLDDVAGADQPDQEGQQRGLLLGRLHSGLLGEAAVGDLDELAQYGVERRIVPQDVVVQLGRDRCALALGHRGPLRSARLPGRCRTCRLCRLWCLGDCNPTSRQRERFRRGPGRVVGRISPGRGRQRG